jgi:VWA domain-containing protein/aerotolerance regulator-like protein
VSDEGGSLFADVGASLGAGALLLAAIAIPLALLTWLGEVGFANPWGLLLALAALPLLLLFVLRTRRKVQSVGSLLFWQAIARDQRHAQTPFKRLRSNLVLVLLLLALAALTYGLAEPIIKADARSGRALLILVDTSASMSSRDREDGPTRLEEAQRRARELLGGLARRDHAAILAVDEHARLVVRWTDDEAAWERGLNELSARPLGTDLGAGLLAAVDAAADAPGEVEVVLLSDGGGPAPPPVELGAPLRFLSLGSEGENIGFLARTLRPGQREQSWELFASVANWGQQPRTCVVALEQDGRPVAARKLTLPAGGQSSVVFEERLGLGALTLRLVPEQSLEGPSHEAYTWDDTVHLPVPDAQRPRVALVGELGRSVWERALRAAGAEVTARLAGRETLAVFLGSTVPARLPPCDVVLVAPPGPTDAGARLRGEAQPVVDLIGDHREPLLEFVTLGDFAIPKGRGLALDPGARVLFQGRGAGGEPVVQASLVRRGGRQRVVLGFDPSQTRWPQRASFPIFVANCLADAAKGRPLELPAGISATLPVRGAATLTTPEGQSRPLTVRAGEATLDGLWPPGLYELRDEDGIRRLGVNPKAAGEGKIAPRAALEADVEQLSSPPERVRPLEIGRWFALLAVVLLTLEAWAFHRRW